MKQFAIIGCGRFGSSIAKTLYRLGYNVLVIDKDETVIQTMASFVTHAVQADASDESTLRGLGIRNFEVVVVTIGMNIQSSILITLIAKELGVKTVVAKAQGDLHAKVLYKSGADRVVFPEREMGARVAQNLVSSNILDYIELAPEYSIAEISILKQWVGKNLEEINVRGKYGLNVMAIKKGEKINISPMATDVLSKEDILVVIGHNNDISKLEKR